MDNSPEFVSVALGDWPEKYRMELEFIQSGTPSQNSYVERFNCSFHHEVLDFYIFSRLSEVRGS
jgi:putative transposase